MGGPTALGDAPPVCEALCRDGSSAAKSQRLIIAKTWVRIPPVPFLPAVTARFGNEPVSVAPRAALRAVAGCRMRESLGVAPHVGLKHTQETIRFRWRIAR